MALVRKRTKKVHAWYALRRTLPLWSFEENLRELINVIPRYGVDEIIIKVDTEEFTHGQPLLAWIKKYQENLFRVKEEMEKLGILYSINPWITLGHCDRGRDSRKDLPGLRTIVGHDGAECACCACPLSQVWRENTANVWTLYAQTRPHIIWVEDDIRTFNHRPVRYGCFCPEHMKRFSDIAGKKVSREELVKAVLKPGKPHPWRTKFLDMQADIMIDTVRFLAQTVHKVSPETCLGLMASGPRSHCLEARKWTEFTDALADGKPLYSRPPMGNYHENSLRGFYCSHDSIKITRYCMPPETIEQTEVENVPFTQYSKSAVFTFLEMAVSFAYGSHGVTMNLYDHAGTPMEREPVFGRMLGEKKPFFEGLARRMQEPGIYRGIKLLHHEKASFSKYLTEDSQYSDLREDGYEIMEMLESHGIPTTYEDSNVIAVSGQILRAFSDDEIRTMLSKGVLLDAVAAKVLFDRGYGKEIGLRSIQDPVCIDELGTFSAEEFFNTKFGGADKKFMTLTIPDLGGRPGLSIVELAGGTEVISSIVDPDAKQHHICMYAYENNLGGRAAVHLFDLASAYGTAFNHTFRAEQLQGVVRWLSREHVPVLVKGGVYPLAFRKDCGKRTYIGFFNLTLDEWPFAEFRLADERTVDRLEKLSSSGRWTKCSDLSVNKKDGCVIIRYEKPVTHDMPVFITVKWQ